MCFSVGGFWLYSSRFLFHLPKPHLSNTVVSPMIIIHLTDIHRLLWKPYHQNVAHRSDVEKRMLLLICGKSIKYLNFFFPSPWKGSAPIVESIKFEMYWFRFMLLPRSLRSRDLYLIDTAISSRWHTGESQPLCP